MKINDKHLSYIASFGNVDKEGWLFKKGEFNTSYQRRWCVLKGNLFFYFEKKSDQEPLGVIVLENCIVQLAEGGDSPYTFSIHFTGAGTRLYKLTADDDTSCTAWIKALSISSYRYLQVLVDGLENEIGNLKATEVVLLNNQNPTDCDDKSSSCEASTSIKSEKKLYDIPFSSSIVKASSLNNILDTEESFEKTTEDFLNFDIFSSTKPRVSKSKKTHYLSRSKSSSELHNLASKLSKSESLAIKKQKSPSRRQRPAVLKKLNPKFGKKKCVASAKAQEDRVSGNSLRVGKSNSTPPKKVSSYNDACGFLEMHEKFRIDIENFISVVQ